MPRTFRRANRRGYTRCFPGLKARNPKTSKGTTLQLLSCSPYRVAHREDIDPELKLNMNLRVLSRTFVLFALFVFVVRCAVVWCGVALPVAEDKHEEPFNIKVMAHNIKSFRDQLEPVSLHFSTLTGHCHDDGGGVCVNLQILLMFGALRSLRNWENPMATFMTVMVGFCISPFLC